LQPRRLDTFLLEKLGAALDYFEDGHRLHTNRTTSTSQGSCRSERDDGVREWRL
jgi:hypothetical protein